MDIKTIIKESIECDLMDTENITNCILDYLGIYKMYEVENFMKRREYRITENYTIIATSKKDAKQVLIKHLSITNSYLLYNYTKDLNSFYNGIYLHYFKNNLPVSTYVANDYKYLLNSITEVEDAGTIYGSKSSFIYQYQQEGGQIEYSFIQDPFEDKIKFIYT
jgi:hypothetical protein